MMRKFLSGALLIAALATAIAPFAQANVAIDNFESYTDTADLRATWSLVANYGGSPSRTLDTTGGAGGSQAMSWNAGSPGGGLLKRSIPTSDWSDQTHIRVWQKTFVGGATTLNDVVWRFSVRDGNGFYYDTQSYNALPNGSTALSVNGVWGGGAGGGYIDLPLAGYGDGTGADDWYWKPTTGGPATLNWNGVARVQIIGYSYASNGSFSTLYDDIIVIGPYATNPSPSDGDATVAADVVLSWTTGDYTASHNVYFGTTFNDVNDANTSSAEYKGNQTLGNTSYDPPGNLALNTTYYWRIDEVNGPNTWKGNVWSFIVPDPALASNPSPADATTGVETNVALNWSAGIYTADMNGHDVYLGTNFNDVNDADTFDLTGIYQGTQDANSYTPSGTLEKSTTYYWRVDEVNGPNTWKGDVWSFATSGYEQLTGSYYAHDPVIIRQDDTYYVFRTGTKTPFRTSTDMHYWQSAGYVWPNGAPAWTGDEVPNFNPNSSSIWAPDISYFNGKYHLYYSISVWGSNDSCIGLATNTTLDPCDPNYLWVDSGGPLISSEGTNYNAIDPALFLDEQSQETTAWLAFGSYWTGIKLTQIDIATGLPVSDPPVLYSISWYSTNEAAFIVYRNGYYYLFVSFGRCCNGVDSTYNVRVGRATSVTGPYSDKDGVPMLNGGGTQVTWPTTRWKGPGHNAVLLDDNGKDWLIHHAYDAENNGSAYLRIHELSWTPDGWPTLTKPNCADVHNLGFGLSPDWTQDCYVDSYDLGFLVDAWLNNFDWQEFADLAGQWLQCNDPRDANCTPNW